MGAKVAGKIAPVVRVAIGALFIYAGGMKVLDPHGFALQVAHYRILPHAASVALALYLPWLEFLCGASLVFKFLHRGALMITGALMLIFIAALASAWMRGLRISCGCVGSTQGIADYGIVLLRDFAILACIAFLWRKSRAEAS